MYSVQAVTFSKTLKLCLKVPSLQIDNNISTTAHFVYYDPVLMLAYIYMQVLTCLIFNVIAKLET